MLVSDPRKCGRQLDAVIFGAVGGGIAVSFDPTLCGTYLVIKACYIKCIVPSEDPRSR